MHSCSLDVVVPVYDEAECIDELLTRMTAVRHQLHADGVEFRLILVDDGSTDRTVEQIREYSADLDWVALMELTRNFGHQAAVTAGLDASTADYTCIIDADLQDPPELIGPMLEQLQAGDLDVVYGVRVSRNSDSRFKRATAQLFYKSIRRLSGLDIPQDTGDFRVMTRRITNGLRELSEHNRLIRILIPWMGCRAEPFPYERSKRFAGSTKYPVSKMVALAMHAVFAYSLFPIRLVQALGLFLLLAVGLALPVSGALWLTGVIDPGAPLLFVLAFTLQTGIVVLAVGMVGGYVHRIQDEVKGRPIYVRRDAVLGDRHCPAFPAPIRSSTTFEVPSNVSGHQPAPR